MRTLSFSLVSLAILTIGFFVIAPQITTAEGLVTCQEAGSCNFCQLIVMINDIVSWIIIMATLFSVLVLAYAGFLLIFSRGDRSALEKGKKIFFQSIIGILIMLAGWTIVDTAFKIVTGNEFGMWNEVRCGAGEFQAGVPQTGISLTAEEITVISGVDQAFVGQFTSDHNITTISGGGNCPGALPSEVLGIPGESGKYLRADAANNFIAMRAAAAADGITLRLSSAWRSQATQEEIWVRHNCDVTGCAGTVARPCSRGGSGSNHNGGVAVDISGSYRGTAIYNWLKANGGPYGFNNNLGADDPVHWSPSGR